MKEEEQPAEVVAVTETEVTMKIAEYSQSRKKKKRRQKLLPPLTLRYNSNSYPRDMLGDILGKDMYYPFTRFDEESNHEDASDTGAAPKQQQQLLSQLEAHGAEVSTEDANHKFLRSLPSAWSNLAMTMRTNPEIDNLSIDDLYNNLRVFEKEIQVKSGFPGAYNTCTPSTSSTNAPEKEVLAGFADEVIYSLFAKQTEDLDLLHEDLEQIDDESSSGWKNGKKKRDSLYQHQEAGKQEKNQMGLLTMDDGIVNWGEHTEAEETNHALMAISSSNEVSLCSKTCIDSYIKLSTGDEQLSTVGAKKSTSDQDKGQREGKAPMISEETPKKPKETMLPLDLRSSCPLFRI
ncbi:hypothetical protein Tco_0461217 [Tanacetum coccineum]